MTRRKLSKAERQVVYNKCKSHCAYCGCDLEYKDMQVDHLEPISLGGADDLPNMLPACRSCNHYKSTLTIEKFRQQVDKIPDTLTRDNVTYQIGKRFGKIKATTDKTKFYFERIEVKDHGQQYNK